MKLTVTGADSVFTSSLCASCPHSPAGCCVAPPRYDWSDLGRVVGHGGTEWLLAQLDAGRLVRVEHGLAVRREKRRVLPTREAPRVAKCTFHDGTQGCTIDERQRPATCNFYLCESSLEHAVETGHPHEAAHARAVHDRLVGCFTAWDAELDQRVRAQWPAETRYSPAFFEWLGDELRRLRAGTDEPRWVNAT